MEGGRRPYPSALRQLPIRLRCSLHTLTNPYPRAHTHPPPLPRRACHGPARQTPDDERRKLLSFVVVGGGPTGVEVAAELHDMIFEDLKELYPGLVQVSNRGG